MNPQQALSHQTEFCAMLTQMYLSDLNDADLLVRAIPGTNHIAWQMGHMIAGSDMMLTALGHKPLGLPDGFVQAHSKETAASDDPQQFKSKAEYLELFERAKQAVLAAAVATPAETLDEMGPESMRAYAPTVADVLLLASNHWLMHAGQFAIIRRKLGKPPMF